MLCTVHTHTHTHTTHNQIPTAQENAQTHLQTCTASRHYHLYTKFADSCGYSRLKKLFVRVSSSELWARHLCRRFHSEIVRAKALSRYRYLPNLSICDSRRSPTSALLLSLFRVMAFETAAIKDNTGTKTVSDGALSDKMLQNSLARRRGGHLCRA